MNETEEDQIPIILDPHSKMILDITCNLPKSVSEIKNECNIPLSTLYRKIRKLHNYHLLKTMIKITPEGNKYALYKSNKTKPLNFLH
ncbi:MAG TPA: helix-turn-helix domain-containing protein [Nitrosopumilaceae archaeon]|nr:helix-turn-helix domain-containing protein [Nitrosopumilaceae archaeon]